MTDQRKSPFKSGLFASLFNSLRSHTFAFGSNNIVRNRDGRLNRVGGSGNGTEAALEILADPFVQSCYDRLLEVMAYAHPHVEPASEDPKDIQAADFIRDTLIKKHLEVLVETAALAKLTGVSAHENNYSLNREGQVLVKSVTPIDSERLIYSVSQDSAESQLRIQTLSNPFEGELPPDKKIVDFKYYSVYINNPYGLGIASQLIDYCTFKQKMVELWVRTAQNYSAPVKIGNIPETAEEEEVDTFFDNFKKMSENSIFLLPPGFELKVEDVSATGIESLVKSLIDYCDERIAGLILGENITGKEISNGAQARDGLAAKITERKALSQLNSIGARLSETTITWLTEMNFPKAQPPTLTFSYQESKSETASILESAKRIGIPVDVAKAAEMLEVPYIKDRANRKVLGQNVSTSPDQ